MLVKQSDEVTPWFRRSKLDGRNPLGDDGPGVAARAALRRGQAQQVFADEPRVQIRCGDWRELAQQAPFDLLVLDGGGQGKGDEPPLEPAEWLRPGGVVVLDDFTPGAGWPPRVGGSLDEARLYWLEHPRLRTAEVRVTPTAASLVATYIG